MIEPWHIVVGLALLFLVAVPAIIIGAVVTARRRK